MRGESVKSLIFLKLLARRIVNAAWVGKPPQYGFWRHGMAARNGMVWKHRGPVMNGDTEHEEGCAITGSMKGDTRCMNRCHQF